MPVRAVCVLMMLAVLTAGCTDSDRAAPSPTTAPATTEEPDLTDAEVRVIDEAVMVEDKGNYPGGSAVSDADFVRFGRDLCLRFDAGDSFESVVGFAMHEWDARLGRRLQFFPTADLVGASVGSLCEEHTGRLD